MVLHDGFNVSSRREQPVKPFYWLVFPSESALTVFKSQTDCAGGSGAAHSENTQYSTYTNTHTCLLFFLLLQLLTFSLTLFLSVSSVCFLKAAVVWREMCDLKYVFLCQTVKATVTVVKSFVISVNSSMF